MWQRIAYLVFLIVVSIVTHSCSDASATKREGAKHERTLMIERLRMRSCKGGGGESQPPFSPRGPTDETGAASAAANGSAFGSAPNVGAEDGLTLQMEQDL